MQEVHLGVAVAGTENDVDAVVDGDSGVVVVVRDVDGVDDDDIDRVGPLWSTL